MSKVIIADDEYKVCQLIRNLVSWQDFDMEVVGVAGNGVEAIALIEETQPDLVITDIRMPGYDGIEMIRRTKEINKEIDFIIISGYRHFDYAQSAIRYGVSDYLLKPIKKDELTATLTKMAQRHKERQGRLSEEETLRHRLRGDIERLRLGLFSDLVLNPAPQIASYDLRQINQDYHYNFAPGLFQVIYIKPDPGYKANNETMKYLSEKIRQMVRTILKPHCFDAKTLYGETGACCLLNYCEQNKDLLRKQYKTLLGEITMQCNIFEQMEITIGLGEVVPSPEQLPDSYASARTAVEQRLYLGTGKLIEGQPPTGETATHLMLTPEVFRKLSAAVEILDKDAVIQLIRELHQSADQACQRGCRGLAEAVCSFYRRMLYELAAAQLPVEQDQQLAAQFCESADRCGSVWMLFEYLELATEELLGKIITEKMQADTRPIRQAKLYIQENYMQPLSLEDVSNLVGFNTSYFSTLFKKETGKNFVEYLTEVRMEMAKELLRDTRKSVLEICANVGYSDLKHFTRRFIKHTGIKPTEYRKIYS